MIEDVNVVGVTRMVERGNWSAMPRVFAQFVINRKGVRAPDGSVAYIVVEGRAELAELKDEFFKTAVGLTLGGMELVRRWIGGTPDERVVLALALDSDFVEEFDTKKEALWLVPGYVECECEEDYLKVVPEGGAQEGEIACTKCGIAFDELPDARLGSVEDAGLPYDQRMLEFAGNA